MRREMLNKQRQKNKRIRRIDTRGKDRVFRDRGVREEQRGMADERRPMEMEGQR